MSHLQPCPLCLGPSSPPHCQSKPPMSHLLQGISTPPLTHCPLPGRIQTQWPERSFTGPCHPHHLAHHLICAPDLSPARCHLACAPGRLLSWRFLPCAELAPSAVSMVRQLSAHPLPPAVQASVTLGGLPSPTGPLATSPALCFLLFTLRWVWHC